jgi:hypothetical protein
MLIQASIYTLKYNRKQKVLGPPVTLVLVGDRYWLHMQTSASAQQNNVLMTGH